MPINGLRKANATACAALSPTSKAVGKPALAWRRRHQFQIGRDALPRVRADQQVSSTQTSRVQRGLQRRDQVLQMLARGQFRHHAAIFGVHCKQRRTALGQNLPVAHHSGRWFQSQKFQWPEWSCLFVAVSADRRISSENDGSGLLPKGTTAGFSGVSCYFPAIFKGPHFPSCVKQNALEQNPSARSSCTSWICALRTPLVAFCASSPTGERVSRSAASCSPVIGQRCPALCRAR